MRYLLLILFFTLQTFGFGAKAIDLQKSDVKKVLTLEKSNLKEPSYYQFRYYSPDTGTYISQDPIKLSGGDNLYAYTKDANFLIDPMGLTPVGQEGFSVYGLFEAGAKEPYYIGVTNDATRRRLEHLDSGRLNGGQLQVIESDLNYAQARGKEQYLIEKHGTKTGTIGQEIGPNNKGNKVNSFDKTRTDARGKKFKAEYDKAMSADKTKIKCG